MPATGVIVVNKPFAARQTFSGLNTYTGSTQVSVGNSRPASPSRAARRFGTNSAVVMGTTGGTLNLAGFKTTIGSITGGSGANGNVTLGWATLTVGGRQHQPRRLCRHHLRQRRNYQGRHRHPDPLRD